MTRIIAGIVAVALLVAFAIAWRAPATLAGREIERASNGKVRLVGTDGTVWSGRGVLSAGRLQIPLSWRMQPLPLLRREIAFAVAPAGDGAVTPRGSFSFAPDMARLRDVKLEVPAGQVVTALVPQQRIVAAGTLAIEATALDWGLHSGDGDITARWQGASLGLDGGPSIGLGDVEATLTAQGSELRGPIGNEGGDIGLSGSLALSRAGTVAVRLTLRPRNPEDPRWAAMGFTGLRPGDSFPLEWQWRAW